MKNVLVGCSKGIGLEVGKLLLSETSSQIVGISRSSPPLKDCRFTHVAADLNDDLALTQAISEIDFSEIDNIIYCAGINPVTLSEKITSQLLTYVFQVNFFAFARIAQAFSQEITNYRETSIVAIGSIWSSFGIPGRSIYGASKGAISSYCKHLSAELRPRGCLVNCISPGFTDTSLTAKTSQDPHILRAFERHPYETKMNPRSVAKHILSFTRPHNKYITGQEIFVDNGFSAHV